VAEHYSKKALAIREVTAVPVRISSYIGAQLICSQTALLILTLCHPPDFTSGQWELGEGKGSQLKVTC